jgi:Na+/proline symporter
MIGASLSGVTFISVPGEVGGSQFQYMVMVLGYLLGYFIIANVLLPMYYRLNLTSIYTYLEGRFGKSSYKTGASFFLLSRVIGASFRMYLVVSVLQKFVFDAWNVPLYLTVILFVLLIVLYTFKGGIKTIVWTDTLQTTFMLTAVVITVVLISKELDLSIFGLFDKVLDSEYAFMVNTDWSSKTHFLKHFLSGAFISIVMTGLDQDMMQKNLSCKNIKDAKKNIYWMSASLVPVNFLFLILGGAMYMYTAQMGIDVPSKTDHLFPLLAFEHLGMLAGIVFIIGLISAAYSSADSALTSLTTSFSIDILNIERKNLSSKQKKTTRYIVHFSFAILLSLVIILFDSLNDDSIVNKLFTFAGYTYGPLLGLYSFGLFTNRKVEDKYVPIIAIAAPVISYILNQNSVDWFWNYKFGFELLIVNGGLTFLGLLLISTKRNLST